MTNSNPIELVCPQNKSRGRHHFVPVSHNGGIKVICLTCSKTQDEISEAANVN